MQTARKTLKALTNTIKISPVFRILSSPDRRILRWAEDCANEALSLDFSHRSDAELRAELHDIETLTDSRRLARSLATASQAVTRRLGAWQVFDPDAAPEPFTSMHLIADQVAQIAGFGDSIRYFTELDFARTPEFKETLEASLDAQGIIGQERSIVRELLYVAELGKTTLPADISLSGDFYSAVSDLDVDRAVEFNPSRQQIIAAALLTQGVIVEMDAGEGKTISTAMAALAFAGTGSRVHVLTANDYLTQRDAEWLAPVYESLGVSVAPVTSPMEEEERRSSYARMVVYSTVREIGFDYLRDNLKVAPKRPVQPSFDVAIVDESDHVLIDQRRTPLIISSGEAANTATFERSHIVVRQLLKLHSQEIAKAQQVLTARACSDADAELAMLYAADPNNEALKRIAAQRGDSRQRLLTHLADVEDSSSALDFENRYYYRVDTGTRTVRLTERGEAHIDASLGTGNSNRTWAARSQAHQFLKAYTLFARDIDYVVADDGVVLVDLFNGRLLPDNRYLHGLQAALEAKEGLPPSPVTETLAQVTITGVMSRYTRVSGLTGTALEAQDDFRQNYGLPTIRVQPTRPCRRTDFAPSVLNDTETQHSAILCEVKHWHTLGRPVLIGTSSVEESQEISSLLADNNVSHHLLNAVNSEREAQIVRDAGNFAAVTVATNMAGRGTDIVLQPDLNQRILEATRAVIDDRPLDRFIIDCATPAEALILVTELRALDNVEISVTGGATVRVTPTNTLAANTSRFEFGLGLCVIGLALNTSPRIDRQLMGRAGRQGAFGASRLIVSAQDTPIAFSRLADSLRRVRTGDNRRMLKLVQSVQSESEADSRWHTTLARDYAAVLEAQTFAFHRWRQHLMTSSDWQQRCSDLMTQWATAFISLEFTSLPEIGYDSVFDGIQRNLWADVGIDCDWMYGLGKSALTRQLDETLTGLHRRTRDEVDQETFDSWSKKLWVSTADDLWPQHLEHLQDVSLSCAIAGPTHRAAVGEFIEQSHGSFLAFLDDVNHEAVPKLMALRNLEPHPDPMEPKIVIHDEILSVLA